MVKLMRKNNLESLFQRGFKEIEQDLTESEKFHKRVASEMDQMKNMMEQRSNNRRLIRNKQQ